MNDRTRYLLLLLLAVLPTVVKAQWNFDIPVVEAYINDIKQQPEPCCWHAPHWS